MMIGRGIPEREFIREQTPKIRMWETLQWNGRTMYISGNDNYCL